MNKKIKIFIVCFAVILFFIIFYIENNKNNKDKKYKIQFAHAASSFKPGEYEAYEGSFLGNHIYYRLLPEESRPWVPYITNKISVACEDKKSATFFKCKSLRISFKPNSFSDCAGHIYTYKDIQIEFEKLLNSAAYLIPNWKECVGEKGEICILASYLPDIKRRMQDNIFRFGWLKAKPTDKVFGSGPYCLYSNPKSSQILRNGILIPKVATSNLSIIEYYVSQKKEDDFDLALYGTVDLLTETRQNLQYHSPTTYYVVTNANLARYNLPWNTNKAKNTIRSYLISQNVIFPGDSIIENISPPGDALNISQKSKPPKSKKFKFAIPNYLPNCEYLATLLNNEWSEKSNTKAVCTSIVDYVENKVWSKKRDWDAFLVSVSPSNTSRNEIKTDYFSPSYKKSWVYNYPKPEKLYYRVGLGQSLVTVNKEKICDIRPNALGFADFFITDLINCEK